MSRDYYDGLRVRHDTGPSVDLAGVPQIPDIALRLISAGCNRLPRKVEAEADAAIDAATAELRRRKDEARGDEEQQPVEMQMCGGASRDKQRRGREGKE